MEEAKRFKIVIIVLSALGILSLAAGFTAELTRIKPSQITYTMEKCVYPESPAFPLGLVAAFALVLADIIIFFETGNAVPGGGPCVPGSLYNLAFSCVTSVVAFMTLLAAAVQNYNGGSCFKSGDYCECYCVKPGVFAIGAVISLVSVCSSLVCYIYLCSPKDDERVRHGVVLVQVHQLPATQDPALHA